MRKIPATGTSNSVIVAVIGLWLVYVAGCMAAMAGLIWAAFHFLHKYW